MVSLRITLCSCIVALCFAANNAQAQNSFFQKLEAEISYASIDGWETSRGPYVLENNDGSALGVGLRYPLKKDFFLKANYQRARLFSSDLQQHYGLSNIFLNAGRSFKVFKKGELAIKAGWARLSEPTYFSFITEVPGSSQTSVTHTFAGKTAFNYLSAGVEYRYRASEELYIGISGDIYSAFSSTSGATMFSLFMNMRLFN